MLFRRIHTLLSCTVEDFNVFELYTNACSQIHHVCDVVLVSSLDGAIGMCPIANRKREKAHYL